MDARSKLRRPVRPPSRTRSPLRDRSSVVPRHGTCSDSVLLPRRLDLPLFLATLPITTGVVCVPRCAAGEPSGIVLHWSAPEGCPDRETVQRRVIALAGPAVGVEADASILQTGGRMRLELHVKRSGNLVGERILEGDSCVELAESAAVILAMSGTTTAFDAPKPVAPPPPPPSPRPAAPPPPVPIAPGSGPDSSPRRGWFRITPVGALDVGTLPEPAIGGGLALAAWLGRGVAVGITGAVWAANQGTLAGASPAQGATFGLITGDASGCYSMMRGTFELSPCALLEVASVSATGFGVSHIRTGNAKWVSVGFGARLRWQPMNHFGVALDVDGIVPIPDYYKYVIHDGPSGGQVYQTGPIAARAVLGPEVRF